jgi:hypothetical protein
MKSTDKFLIGIVAAIVLLIVVALVVTLTLPGLTYQTEDTPEGVAHNYLVALQKEEYERAYSYLSTNLEGYPASAEEFAEHVQDDSWRFRLNTDTTLSVVSARITGSLATVRVRESHFRSGDLFDTDQSISFFEMGLQLEEGEWKIVDADYYFSRCWEREVWCK